MLNFTNTYEEIPEGFQKMDCDDVSGTDLFCDEEAFQVLRNRVGLASGIHMIDSGNYHYMTRVFTSLLEEPYILVFWDHHTDMKPAMFDMLSCGSWAAKILAEDNHLKQMLVIGPPQKSFDELPEEILSSPKLVMISEEDFLQKNTVLPEIMADYPLYLSIDRDILSEEYALTNWDQGMVSLEQLLESLRMVCSGRKVLGADICGLKPNTTGREAVEERKKNAPGEEALRAVLASVIA